MDPLSSFSISYKVDEKSFSSACLTRWTSLEAVNQLTDLIFLHSTQQEKTEFKFFIFLSENECNQLKYKDQLISHLLFSFGEINLEDFNNSIKKLKQRDWIPFQLTDRIKWLLQREEVKEIKESKEKISHIYTQLKKHRKLIQLLVQKDTPLARLKKIKKVSLEEIELAKLLPLFSAEEKYLDEQIIWKGISLFLKEFEDLKIMSAYLHYSINKYADLEFVVEEIKKEHCNLKSFQEFFPYFERLKWILLKLSYTHFKDDPYIEVKKNIKLFKIVIGSFLDILAAYRRIKSSLTLYEQIRLNIVDILAEKDLEMGIFSQMHPNFSFEAAKIGIDEIEKVLEKFTS